jgi:general secretion pathway protein D
MRPIARLRCAFLSVILLGGIAWAQPPSAAPAELMPLPMMSEKQIRQLVGDIALHLETTGRYRRASASEGVAAAAIPYPPNVVPAAVLVRGDNEYVRLGFVMPPRRVPQLWVQAPASGNAMQLVQSVVRTVLSETSKVMARLRLTDLDTRPVLLSYVDADAALFVLRAMGYSAITDTEALPRDDWYKGDDVPPSPPPPPESPQSSAQMPPPGYGMQGASYGPKFPAIKNLPTTINFDRLPLIVRVPSTDPRNLGVVGAEQQGQYSYYTRETSSTIPSVAAPLAETVAAGTQELLIIYHPDYPEQFEKVRKVLADSIDRPARQVYIEGFVVEVSRSNFDRLGVEWAAQKGQSSLFLGTAQPIGNDGSALSYQRNSLDRLGNIIVSPVSGWQIYARIEALVSENKAEVLSRPSLITLDNRQATIRVGTDLPVSEAVGSNNNIGYKYRNIPIGILLNVRPRVSEDGQEISMLIDATVSDKVAGADLKVTDPDTNAVVVTAPTISTRRVQTYARIRDNQPLIIGGLMSKTVTRGYNRVPLLGSIPVLGALFGHTSVDVDVREVIIVLTPSVVSENLREAKAQYPKDDARFDLTGTTLFKEKVRIGAEDVVDSSNLRFKDRFLGYREAANRVLERDPALASRAPFSEFVGTRVPGEAIFVTGMMYRMLDRLNAGDAISVRNLRVLERDTGLPRAVPLTALMARLGGSAEPEGFFAANPGKALALTFHLVGGAAGAQDMFGETMPEIRVVDCPSRDAWRRTLWDLNQPDERGARFTILLQDASDLRRLQLAVATRNTVTVNGGDGAMRLDRWVPGRMLNVQEVAPHWERTLDADMARAFFVGEHYYAYFIQEHMRAIDALDRALRSPEYKPLVQGLAIPPSTP